MLDGNRVPSCPGKTVAPARWLAGLLCIVLALCADVRAQEPDPTPPQVSVDFFYPPSPLIQHGTPRLVYEMRVSNYVALSYVLESIDVEGGHKTFTFSGNTLRKMMRFFGEKDAVAPGLRLEPGRSAVIYFMLEFDNPLDVPRKLLHTLHFVAPDGSHHALAAEPLRVTQTAPVVVDAPLRGNDWLAGDSVHNDPDAAHRRTILLLGGHPWLAQRYAIDWVRYRIANGVATTWSGPEDQNSSYLCYDAPIYSVADGIVVDAMDGIAENIPHSGKYAVGINFINAGGNHVVVDIGGNRYAFYAHMRPGSVTVKVGERVKAGQILGHVGNTGSSTEPHLHMHIVDRPSFLAGNGVPYEFASLSASGSPEMIVKPHDEMMFRKFGALKPFHADYPANNAAVNFP
jgi:murein DD-endopeptidase